MKIYPAPGRLVRDPASGLEVGSAGLVVQDSDAFWLRRLADGDVAGKAPETSDAAKDVAGQAAVSPPVLAAGPDKSTNAVAN